MNRSRTKEWLAPLGLIALAFVPVAAGASRLAQLGTGAPVTPANERFFDSPVPVVVHVIGATTFLLLGAFQFSPNFRRRKPGKTGWHRVAGRIVVPCGLAAALSGLWMSAVYPLPASDNRVLEGLRLLFGSAMVIALVLAVVMVRRRDFAGHRTWMIRGYAIGMGAGTQVLTNVPWILIAGQPSPGVRAVLMGAGWVINLAVAEYLIRTGSPSGRQPSDPRPSNHQPSNHQPSNHQPTPATVTDQLRDGGSTRLLHGRRSIQGGNLADTSRWFRH